MEVKCKNESCPRFGKVEDVAEWDGFYSYDLFMLKVCPDCGRQRVQIPKPRSVEEPSGFNVNFAKIGSMSISDRKKVLKERSNEDYKKHIKEKKEYLDRSILGKE